MTDLEKAIAYFEDAIKETDEIVEDCSLKLRAALKEQQAHFVVALAAMYGQQNHIAKVIDVPVPPNLHEKD